jgi:hypothetical protein
MIRVAQVTVSTLTSLVVPGGFLVFVWWIWREMGGPDA